MSEGRYAALAGRVIAETDPGLRQDEARVEVSGTDARRFGVHVEHTLGSAANPMTDEQLTAKFRRNAQPVLGDRADELLGVLWSIEEREMAEVVALVRADAR